MFTGHTVPMEMVSLPTRIGATEETSLSNVCVAALRGYLVSKQLLGYRDAVCKKNTPITTTTKFRKKSQQWKECLIVFIVPLE